MLAKCRLNNKNKLGFTIVELLVVIVVIGILAAITVVSYTGITQKAHETVVISDLTNSKNKLAIYYAENGSYPTVLTNNCPTAPINDPTACIKPSPGVVLEYTANAGIGYNLKATYGSISYTVSDSISPTKFSSLATTDPANWLAIGNQVWAKSNLNVGTMVTGATSQTDNSIIEKYCPNNLESNCTTFGALYQWNEAMQYTTTEGAQGICPVGSHIPTDNDWKILEMQLGMTQEQADLEGVFRGTDQGTQLKPGGSSGLNIPLAGFRDTTGILTNTTSGAYLWSSSESSDNAWEHYLASGYSTILRIMAVKTKGFSVRCLGN